MLLMTFKMSNTFIDSLQVENKEEGQNFLAEFNEEHPITDVCFYPREDVEERYISSKESIDKVWCKKDKAAMKIVLSGTVKSL